MAHDQDRNPPKSPPAEVRDLPAEHVAFLWEGEIRPEFVGAVKDAISEVIEGLGLEGQLTVCDLSAPERARIDAEMHLLVNNLRGIKH